MRRLRRVRGLGMHGQSTEHSEPHGECGATMHRMSAKTTPTGDPIQEAFDNAPIGEPETEEERRLVAEARASRARGERTYSSAEIKAVIAEMRRKQEGG